MKGIIRKQLVSFLPTDELKREEVISKFWTLVDKSGGEDLCWPWIGALHDVNAKTNRSYGEYRSNGAHRWSYYLTHQDTWDNDLFVLHKCDNPICCNPNHLFQGTTQDNTADMIKKGRRRPEKYGEECPTSKFKDDAIMEIRHRYADGETQTALAEMFGTTHGHIHAIVHGEVWKHLPVLPLGNIDRARRPRNSGRSRDQHHHNAKLSSIQVEEIRARRLVGERPKELAAEYHVKSSTISHLTKDLPMVKHNKH